MKDLVLKFFVLLFFFCVYRYLLGSGSGSASGSIWTFLGSWIWIRMKTYADPKHCLLKMSVRKENAHLGTGLDTGQTTWDINPDQPSAGCIEVAFRPCRQHNIFYCRAVNSRSGSSRIIIRVRISNSGYR